MKSLTNRIAAPSLRVVSFCTCGDDCELCAYCRRAAHRQACRGCNAALLSCEGIDGETMYVCPNCTRFEPTHAA
jgi:hypothetical protein